MRQCAIADTLTAEGLKMTAYAYLFEWEKWDAQFEKIMEFNPADDKVCSDIVTSCLQEALTNYLLIATMFCGLDNIEDMKEVLESLEEKMKVNGLFNVGTYNYLMARSWIAAHCSSWASLRYFSYYARISSGEIYSYGSNIWQHGRACNLFAVAVYRQTKEYVKWRDSVFKERGYKPVAYKRNYHQQPNPEMEEFIKHENGIYETIIESIQPK